MLSLLFIIYTMLFWDKWFWNITLSEYLFYHILIIYAAVVTLPVKKKAVLCARHEGTREWRYSCALSLPWSHVEVSSHLLYAWGKSCQFPLNRKLCRSHILSGNFWEEKDLVCLLEVEQWFICHPAHSIVTVLAPGFTCVVRKFDMAA